MMNREGAQDLVRAIKEGSLVPPDATASLVSDRLYQHVAMLAPDPSLIPELSHFRSGLAQVIDVHFFGVAAASSLSASAEPVPDSPAPPPSLDAARKMRALLLKAMAAMGEAMQELPPEVKLED